MAAAPAGAGARAGRGGRGGAPAERPGPAPTARRAARRRAVLNVPLDESGHIAVIGMAGRFPGAPDVERFWANLVAGVESVTVFPPEPGADHVRAGGVLDDAECFDAALFGYSPRE